MKKTIKISILALFISLPAILFAQTNPLDSYISQYEGTPGFYYMDMKTNMFSFDENEKDSQKTESNIIDFKIVSFEKTEKAKFDPADIYDNFTKTLNPDVYKGLIDVKSSGEYVEMLVKKEGNQIAEIIIIVQEKAETTLMVATGNFDLKDIAKLRNLKDCKGLEALEKLCED